MYVKLGHKFKASDPQPDSSELHTCTETINPDSSIAYTRNNSNNDYSRSVDMLLPTLLSLNNDDCVHNSYIMQSFTLQKKV